MAIAADSSADLGRSSVSTPWTVAFNNAAGDCLTLELYTDASTPPAVTYGGAAMTLVDSVNPLNSIAYYGHFYVLMAPATGSNNFVIARSTSLDYIATATSYSGTDTTGSGSAVIEAFTHANSTSQVQTLSVTVSTANAWLVGLGAGSANLIASTNTTARATSTAAAFRWYGIDSNGPQATGTRSLALDDQGDFAQKAMIVASMKPAGGGGGGRTTKNTRAFPLGMAIGMHRGEPGVCSGPMLRHKSGLYVPERLAA